VAAPTAKAAAPLSRKRRILIWTLIVLATVLAIVSILTTWVNRQMLDTTAFNKATSRIIQDPQVQSALAAYTVNQLYENVDVAQALQQRLPKNLKPLGPPLAGALQAPATQSVKLLLQRPRVQQLFIQASTVAHEKLVNVLENKTGRGISTGNGVVTLDTHQLVVDVGTQLGLSPDALAKIPANTGEITLLKSDQLKAAQTGVQAIRVLSAWLLVGVLVLYGLAIYLARGARRAALRNAGFGLALAGLVVLVIRGLLGNYLTDALASPGYQPATHRLYLIGTSILGQIGAAALLYGAIAALGAMFAGPSSIATSLRRRLAPVLNERPGIVWGAVGFVYLLLIWWGGTHALRVWWGILLLAGLIALGLVALRRQTLAEFPSGATLEPAPAGGAPSTTDELARLQQLHKSGVISDDEFAERAKKLAAT
jgi:putative oligomerization/nucleic acid binding protein